MEPDFTNFDKWEKENTQFIKETQGFPKMPISPNQLKNQKLGEIVQYINDTSKLDKIYLVNEITKAILIGQ